MTRGLRSGRHRAAFATRWGDLPRPRRAVVALLAAAASAVVVGFGGAKPALACGAYWTVGCEFYSQDEGHTITNRNGNSYEYVYTTFDPTNVAIKAIWTTAGGGWISSVALLSGQAAHFSGAASTDKFGCFNNNAITVWVNCRAADSI